LPLARVIAKIAQVIKILCMQELFFLNSSHNSNNLNNTNGQKFREMQYIQMVFTYEWARKYRETLQMNYLKTYKQFWRPSNKFVASKLKVVESAPTHAKAKRRNARTKQNVTVT
jgi:hypothetical protein